MRILSFFIIIQSFLYIHYIISLKTYIIKIGSSIRNDIDKYVQGPVFKDMGLCPYIHILDCTWLEVESNNANYEKSEVTKEDGVSARGYKLASLRG